MRSSPTSIPIPSAIAAVRLAAWAVASVMIATASPVVAQVSVPAVLVKLLDQVEVPAREAGVLVALPVQEGTLVEENARLALVDDKEARLFAERADLELRIATKQASSKVAVQSAEKNLAVAEQELRRAEESVAAIKNSISQTELDRLKLAVEQGRLSLDKARQDWQVAGMTKQLKQVESKTAQRNVERREIVSPFRGMVVQLHRQRGEWVEPGEKLLRLIRLDRLRAEGFIHARDAASDLMGRAVQLTVQLPQQPDAKFSGVVTFVSPEVDPVNGTVRILAEIDNGSLQLRPGLKGSLTILERASAERPATTEK